jgi:hypothetical protein
MTDAKKGHFILVNLYDQRYYDIYLDGELVAQTYKEDYDATLFDFDNVTQWCEKTGLKNTEFRYSYIDVYGEKYNDSNYDANDYMDDLPKVLALNIEPSYQEISWKEIRRQD